MININPGVVQLKALVKDVLDSILNSHPILKDFQVLSSYPESQKNNRSIYLTVSSRENESTGIDNYGGIERGYHMLTRLPSTKVPGTAIEWVSLDSSKYLSTVDDGNYFFAINADEFDQEFGHYKNFRYSYAKVKKREETLTERYDGVTTTFNISETPIDPSTLYIYYNGTSITRGSYYTFANNQITFTKTLPRSIKITVEYLVQEELVEDIPFERNRWSKFKEGIYLYFGENPIPGDELVLLLFNHVRPTYHVFTGRSNFSLMLDICSSNKKEEDLVSDYLWPRLRMELRTELEKYGWVVASTSFSEYEAEDWDAGGHLYLSTSQVTLTVSGEWTRLVPMIKEYVGHAFSSFLFQKKDYY